MQDWIDPRDAMFLAWYMATGDVMTAAEKVGYPPILAGKFLKSDRAIHWMRGQQRKRMAKLMLDADEIVSRYNDMYEKAMKEYEEDPKENKKSRDFAVTCLEKIADLLGLNAKASNSGASNGPVNIIFGSVGTPSVAGSSNPKRPVLSVPRRDDVPGGIQPGMDRSLEPALPGRSEDVHDPA